VVYYHLDPPSTAALQEARENGRHDLALDGQPVIGVFGRIINWKGQHVVLDALGRLPGVHALLVGDEREDPAYVARLRDQVARLGLGDRVRFTGFRRDVMSAMAAVDVVVHSSVAPEPFGRVIVEGMLVGRPVIATVGGGVGEIIDDGVNGLLVPPGDAGALARAIAALLANAERASALAAAGRQKAVASFANSGLLGELDRHIAEVAS
jgi:glycosyltransferase involved in cell wall biosynthesis